MDPRLRNTKPAPGTNGPLITADEVVDLDGAEELADAFPDLRSGNGGTVTPLVIA